MANYVQISIVGMRYAHMCDDIALPDAVARMKVAVIGKVRQTLPDRPDVIVLPECCDVPANYEGARRVAFVECRANGIAEELALIARTNRCHIAYPTLRRDADGIMRISMHWIDRDGTVIGIYDKNYATLGEMERLGVRCGDRPLVLDTDFGKVACLICFDLNFEPLLRAYAGEQVQLIVFGSAYHGGLMQAYWAYACRAYFAGAIAGPVSSIVSPVGQTVVSTTNYCDYASAAVNLDYALVHLDNHVERLEALRQRYGRAVNVADPGHLGAVLVSGESGETPIRAMLDEFGIVTLDRYFDTYLQSRNSS